MADVIASRVNTSIKSCYNLKSEKNNFMKNALKILILIEAYPDGSSQPMAFAHSRNQYYLRENHLVTVLAFNSKSRYIIDGIQVLPESDFCKSYDLSYFDIIVSHAPNLKNHIRFLMKYSSQLKKIVFFFHGHEILIKSKYYPKPFNKLSHMRPFLYAFKNRVYDCIKVLTLKILFRYYFLKRCEMVFVSNWLKCEFLRNVTLKLSEIDQISHIIPNSINSVFEKKMYSHDGLRKADFITIRQFDGPKYGIDLVVKIASENPNYEFHIYGNGSYFDYYEYPNNVKIFKQSFRQDEIPALLNQYRAALMPTRLDAQGVMVCEMATFGIPVITSDIPVCREVLHNFSNVLLLSNDRFSFNVEAFLSKITRSSTQNRKYFSENTIAKELALFNRIKL